MMYGRNTVIFREQREAKPEEHHYLYPVPEEVKQEIALQLQSRYGTEWTLEVEHIKIVLKKEN